VYESSPPDFTRLEDIADDAGINPEQVCEWLRQEIERKRALVDVALDGDSLLALAHAIDVRGNGNTP
jgi:hypothetical protein